jgi:hypothetical protein
MTSAYPISTEVLEDRVRTLAANLGAWPSQRRVMRECRVGAPRADAALAAVKRSGFDPTRPARPLTLVPASEPATAPVTAGPSGAHHAEPTAPATETTGTAGAPGTGLPVSAGASAASAEAGGDRGDWSAAPPLDGQVSWVAETPAPTAPDASPAAAADTAGAPAAAPIGRVVRVPRWPILLIALGAFVSIWGGWVGLGKLAGFGEVQLLPGIVDEFVIDSAITLPLGVEAYAFYALWVWLAPAAAQVPARARRFACWSSIAALGLGLFGQATYHLLITSEVATAPPQVVVFVSCLPVLVLGAGAALAHLTHHVDEVTR